MMATTSSSISPPNLLHINTKPKHISFTHIIPTKTPRNFSCKPLISPLTLSKHPFQTTIGKKPRILQVSALVSEDVGAVTNVVSSETTQQIVETTATTSGDDGVYSIISILLFIAFLALSILTIGVVYIGVTDFLQKREKDKFVKEEEAKKKKGGKKKVGARARDGPRGFGQKIDDDFDD